MLGGINDKYRFETFVGFPTLHPVSGVLRSFRTVSNLTSQGQALISRLYLPPRQLIVLVLGAV